MICYFFCIRIIYIHKKLNHYNNYYCWLGGIKNIGRYYINNNNNNQAIELKILWNMKVTMIPIVIDALGTVTKGLVEGPSKLQHY